MKYLELTNTKECMKLAECLIGSVVIYHSNTIKHKYYELAHTANEADYRAFIIIGGRDPETGNSIHSFCNMNKILLPLDNLKLNPFKCMEHGVRVLGDSKVGVKERDLICEIATYNSKDFAFVLGKYRFVEENISLDLTVIENGEINGASIVEV
jgi:hypothetical protein